MRKKFVLKDSDTFATIYRDGKPVGTIHRGRILRHHNEPAFSVYDKDAKLIGTAETWGELRKIVHGDW